MKTILCYGDSNTWGYIAETQEREPKRWCGILSQTLGGAYDIIEEGLNGRRTAWDDPAEPGRNGETTLVPCLEKHKPIDLVIIMLGTNDLKKQFLLTSLDIAYGMEKLLKIIINSNAGVDGGSPQILLLCPPHIGTLTVGSDEFADSQEISIRLSKHYEALAQEYGCSFFDTAQVVKSEDLPDGVHMNTDAHHRLGNRLAQIVGQIL